ncbi:MAG: RNA 2',3'-cyclic phosphodiesterase [bacterium]|nr:RNA 2',3'-cyclic phosphodiesterase [bacterium]
MRCFLALDLPLPVRNYLAKTARSELQKGTIKFVPPEHIHLTLAFVGEVDDDTARGLEAIVDAAELSPMQFALAGLGHFPPRGAPRVVWAGLAGDIDALTRLQGEVTAAITDLGIELDRRPFSPHVTLGRVKSPFGAYAIIDELARVGKDLRDKPFPIATLTLYASELQPAGPVYTPIRRRTVG